MRGKIIDKYCNIYTDILHCQKYTITVRSMQ